LKSASKVTIKNIKLKEVKMGECNKSNFCIGQKLKDCKVYREKKENVRTILMIADIYRLVKVYIRG
jgi:hypothetical protein